MKVGGLLQCKAHLVILITHTFHLLIKSQIFVAFDATVQHKKAEGEIVTREGDNARKAKNEARIEKKMEV